MITLDTSALLAYLNRGDPAHMTVAAQIDAESGPLLLPVSMLGELGYLLERRAPRGTLPRFLSDIEAGAYSLDCGESDFTRLGALVTRYADLPLGLVDAAVIACAERNGGRVLTLDLRHFGVVAREGRIAILPT
jgi:predicted nucleic acid-binding protein